VGEAREEEEEEATGSRRGSHENKAKARGEQRGPAGEWNLQVRARARSLHIIAFFLLAPVSRFPFPVHGTPPLERASMLSLSSFSAFLALTSFRTEAAAAAAILAGLVLSSFLSSWSSSFVSCVCV
jgi:hypothetical protein